MPTPPLPDLTVEEAQRLTHAGAWLLPNQTVIGERLDLSGVHLPHGLRWRHITFRCEVELSDAHAERSVDLSACTFEGGLRLTDARIQGTLELNDAVVGELDFGRKPDERGLVPFNDEFKSLDMSRARIEGGLLADGIRVAGNWDFSDATMGGGWRRMAARCATSSMVRSRRCAAILTVNHTKGIAARSEATPGSPERR